MRNQPIDLGTLVIASGQTDSPLLAMNRRPVVAIAIYAPATLPETITIQISPDGVAWNTHPVTAGLGAGNLVVIDPFIGYALRIHASAAVAANRSFVVQATEDIT